MKEPVRIVKIPKELKPVKVPPKPEIKYTVFDTLIHWSNKTKDFMIGVGNTIGNGFTDIWNIVQTIPKIPETSENVKKTSNNIIWIVGGLIVLAVIIIVAIWVF